ncbi:MAG: amidohydrolase family protein [Bryobacteraceae bacterium]|nr:amidohydrolase family protein [Bryobacteraceae bacterium]
MRDGFAIYDTHVHIGSARHSGRRHHAADLVRAMDGFGIEHAVAIPFPLVEDYRREHDEIAAAQRTYRGRFVGAACLNPFVPEREFRDEVRRCREVHGFRALKFQPQFQPLNPLLDSSTFLFETALENRMALIVHTGSGIPFSLPSMYLLAARRYPELKFVLAHCGGGGLFHGEAIVAASLFANIYLELSSLMPHQVLEVLHRIPSKRLMAGTDLPENLRMELLKLLELPVSDEDKRNILFGTAKEVFGLPD